MIDFPEKKIRMYVESILSNWSVTNSIPIVYENVSFERPVKIPVPPDRTPETGIYVKENIIFRDTRPAGIGILQNATNLLFECTLVLRIIVPAGRGVNRGLEILHSLRNEFSFTNATPEPGLHIDFDRFGKLTFINPENENPSITLEIDFRAIVEW